MAAPVSMSFDIRGLPEFQKLLSEAPAEARAALWVGTRRSLASFRRTFLQKTPVKIKGRGATPPGDAGERKKTIGASFRWIVKPGSLAAAKVGKQALYGSIYTPSFAAQGLEIGGQVKARKRRVLALPIVESGAENDAGNGRPKPSWKSFERVMRNKKRTHRFFWVTRGERTIVYAQRRPRRSEGASYGPLVAEDSFPIFTLLNVAPQKKDRLRFFRTWREYQGEVDRRFREEVDLRLKKLATGKSAPIREDA